ncbi:MAG: tetratricopeptide repeat protein, partial [Nitrospirales bacterium]
FEDDLHYTEPKDWYLPPRQVLGAILLKAGKPVEAEQVYRQDLVAHPQNGWSLFGLVQSLDAQGKVDEAKVAQQEFANSWADADVTLSSSRF